ncbi:MAG: hypothetical protein ACKVJF_13970, partial [Flavobacteriales bacterium]
NGNFAFTTDVTGLQTFPDFYEKGIPLGTQANWGWNGFPNTEAFDFKETLLNYDQNGRNVSYATQVKTPQHAKDAAEYYRSNPHRVHLGNLGFDITKKDGTPVKPEDIEAVDQTLDLWTGILISNFKVEGVPVKVITSSSQEQDALGVSVESALLNTGQLKIRIRFPAPTARWSDYGTQWNNPKHYTSTLATNYDNTAVINRSLDSLSYTVGLKWEGEANVIEKEQHYFSIAPKGEKIAFTCTFSEEKLDE